MLNIDLGFTQAEKFVNMRNKILSIMFMPEKIVEIISGIVKLDEAMKYRKDTIEYFETFIKYQFEEFKDSKMEDLYFVASGFLGTIMFAGGLSVPRLILKALGTMYASESPKDPNVEINELNLQQYVWEIIRYFGGVPSIPYCTGMYWRRKNIYTCLIYHIKKSMF